MAFHVDCAGRHGLVSIDTKPAAYAALEWKCDACKRCIPDRHIGVLHCERCRCNICPDCWTVLLPKIVNAAGYPCFWRQTGIYPPSIRMLGCHRANVGGNVSGMVQYCGLDCPAVHPAYHQPRAQQCTDCANKQGELEPQQDQVAAAAPGIGVAAPPAVFSGIFQRSPQQPPAPNPGCWVPPATPPPILSHAGLTAGVWPGFGGAVASANASGTLPGQF